MSLQSVREIVKIRAGVVEAEYSDDTVDDFIRRAVVGLKDDWTIDNIPANSLLENVVIVQSMLDITYARATRASLDYMVASKEVRTEKQMIVDNCMKLASYMSMELDAMKSKLNILDTEVVVSNVMRQDQAGKMIPESSNAAPPAPVLTVAVVNGKAELEWNELEMNDFSAYQVWYSPSSGIYDPMTYTAQDSSQQGVSTAALSAVWVVQKWKTFYRHNPGNGTWYYVVEALDRNGRSSFSNEVTVTI